MVTLIKMKPIPIHKSMNETKISIVAKNPHVWLKANQATAAIRLHIIPVTFTGSSERLSSKAMMLKITPRTRGVANMKRLNISMFGQKCICLILHLKLAIVGSVNSSRGGFPC